MGYKFLKHTGDIKIRVNEKNIELAFISSAFALSQIITDKTKINSKISKKIKVSGNDMSSLLYNFLEEFLFLLDAKGFILSEIINFKIDKKKFLIICEVLGDKSKNYKFTNDVKAITYHEMKIEQKNNYSVIEFVLDV